MGRAVYDRQTCTKNALLVFSNKTMTIQRMRRTTPRATRASRFGAAISGAMCVGNFRSVCPDSFFQAVLCARHLVDDACADLWWIALALFLICVAEVC